MHGVPGRGRALLLLVAGAGMLGWAMVRYGAPHEVLAGIWRGDERGGAAIVLFTGGALLVLGIHGLLRRHDPG